MSEQYVEIFVALISLSVESCVILEDVMFQSECCFFFFHSNNIYSRYTQHDKTNVCHKVVSGLVLFFCLKFMFLFLCLLFFLPVSQPILCWSVSVI